MRESKFTFSSDVEFEFIIQVQEPTRSVGQALGMVPAVVVTKWGQPLMKLCRKLYKAVTVTVGFNF